MSGANPENSTTHPETHEHLANALETMVDQSVNPVDPGIKVSPVVPAHEGSKHAWFSNLFAPDTWTRLFAQQHLGKYCNFVITNRATGQQVFESMPLYARVGMHLLFYGKEQTKFLRWPSVESLLKQQSFKQGQMYDLVDPEVVIPHITSFMETYSIPTDELLIPNPAGYKTFNEFFARKLKPEARPITAANDPTIITSVADCRLTVWQNVDHARQFWVKGRDFTIPSLLDHDEKLIEAVGANPTLAIFRLAPQDYHRFHSPANTVRGEIKKVDGQYYTVNPQAVNEEFDVFTANRRDIALLHASLSPEPGSTTPIAVVAVGALLVGSIGWSVPQGASLNKGDDLGWFQYGGSTVITLIPESAGVMWDADLLAASEKAIETVVKVGERIGKVSLETRLG